MTKVMKAAMVAALVMVSAAASAQLSVNAGYVNTKGTNDGSKGANGITAGIGYDMNIQGGVGMAWGLDYTYGWNSVTAVGIKTTTVGHFLDIPVRLTYTYPVADNFKVFGFAGPKFVYQIAATQKTDDAKAVNLFDINPDAKRFDIKAGLGAGVNISNFLVKVGYDWGLLDMSQKVEGIPHTAVRMNQFYVTVGYAF